MNEQRVQILLNEYQANLELWKHDDNLRQQRYGVFVNINSLLFVAIGGLVTFSLSILNIAIATTLISFFGFLICLMWHQVQARNAEYIRFRRYQLRSIEKTLKPLSTFSNQWKALNQFETIHFENIKDEFTINQNAKESSAILEGRLPRIISGFWLMVFIVSVVIIMLNMLHYI